jgi:hypothetical protein
VTVERAYSAVWVAIATLSSVGSIRILIAHFTASRHDELYLGSVH